MPATSSATNPLGITINFVGTDDEHKYTSNVNNKVITYTSVTELVGKYFNEFDALTVATRVAKKRAVTVESVIKDWDVKRTTACTYGTRVHEIIEDTINGLQPRHVASNAVESTTFKYVINAANTLRDNFTVIGTEYKIFDHRLRLAGTIDLLLKFNDTYIILDWKTGKEIGDENRYNEFGLGPLQPIADTTKNHYALQLSIYEYLLRYAEYIPVDAPVKRILMHVTPFGIIKMPTDDMTNYVKDLVIDHLLANLMT